MFELEDIIETLAVIFADIINASFENGQFPTSEKCSVVRPLLKPTKDKDELPSYRPLFQASLLSKVIEKAALIQITNYLSQFESIPKFQSAHRKYHSVETALCKIYNDLIIRKASGGCCMLIMLDLSAAFDCINQDTLLQDLYILGVEGTALQWFRTYLKGRCFRVEVEGFTSQTAQMETGICQGTILAPTLFSLYTVELYHILASKGIECHFYADDTQLLIDVENRAKGESIFNEVFQVLVTWMSKRKLKLNADKTECILFGNRHRLDVLADFEAINMPDGATLPFVAKVKNLGVFLDKDLSMDDQLQSTKQKAIGNLINIARVSKYMDKDSRLKLVID